MTRPGAEFAGIKVRRSDYATRPGRPPDLDTALEFGRFEFKYVLGLGLRAAIEPALGHFMTLDPFCADAADRSYLVRSLYFDDPAFGDYREKTDGMLNRRKYRLRTYGRSAGVPVFLEAKGRANQFAYKVRTPVDAAFVADATAGRWGRLAASLATGAGEPAAPFVAAGVRRNLRPRVLVEYRRRPYLSRDGHRFRVTFDGELHAVASRDLAGGDAPRRTVLPGRTIMEIKFEATIPVWFRRLVGAFELSRTSVSKYCLGAEALGLVTNLE
jgi:hypothetical protein